MKKFLIVLLTIFTFMFFNGCSDSKIEYHHVFPQQFRIWFEQKGIDIDNYTIAITAKDHRLSPKSLHSTKWNYEWLEWIKQHPNASKEKILLQLENMLSKRGFTGQYILYNYRTKQPVGKLEVVGSGFWGIFARIGQFIIKTFGANNKFTVFLIWLGSWVAALFGIRVSAETAAGIGLVALIIILAISAYVTYIYPELWYWLIAVVGGVGGIVSAFMNDVGNNSNITDIDIN